MRVALPRAHSAVQTKLAAAVTSPAPLHFVLCSAWFPPMDRRPCSI